jgi:dethiobiotin synthetase
VSAALVHRVAAVTPVRYWKPIQTGIEHDDDTAEVARLSGVPAAEPPPGSVRLERPVSPHLAARLAGRRLAVADIARGARAQDEPARWIVEGAGGVLVPINETESMLDLMAALGLSVLIVARTALGTINHTRLTLEALRTRRLTVAGVVLVGQPNADNRDAIAQYGEVPILGELPILEPLSSATLGRWADTSLDPDGRLREALG